MNFRSDDLALSQNFGESPPVCAGLADQLEQRRFEPDFDLVIAVSSGLGSSKIRGEATNGRCRRSIELRVAPMSIDQDIRIDRTPSCGALSWPQSGLAGSRQLPRLSQKRIVDLDGRFHAPIPP
jgi:hypothetical protein